MALSAAVINRLGYAMKDIGLAQDLAGEVDEGSLIGDVVAGTVSASKPVIPDSNKDITGFRHFTVTGLITTSGGLTITTAGVTITDVDVALSATTGTKIGTATTQKLGFYNATPIVQPSAITQTFATADATHAARTATTLTDSTAGTANTTLQALADGTTYANDVAAIRNNFADLAASNNAIIVDLADTAQLLNSLVDKLQALGLVG